MSGNMADDHKVPCIVCEERNCYSCFGLKVCKACSKRINFVPSPAYTYHDDDRINVTRKIAWEGFVEA